MVSSHDSTLSAQVLCAYSFMAKHLNSRSPLIPPFDSGNHEVLACHGWSLFVSLPSLAPPPAHDRTYYNDDNLALRLYVAGSSSLLLTSSGASFEGIDRTAGR